MRPLINILAAFSLVFLVACSSTPVKDTSSFLYSVPEGSTLTLNQSITIPAHLARRFFQGGQPTLEKHINIYYPHCSIVMNTLADHERTLKPTVFEIVRVQDNEEEASRYILYANRTMVLGDGPLIIGKSTYYYLQSRDEPDVRSMECIQWNDPYSVKYLSIDEVRKSLGNYFTLRLKNDSSTTTP